MPDYVFKVVVFMEGWDGSYYGSDWQQLDADFSTVDDAWLAGTATVAACSDWQGFDVLVTFSS